MNCVCLTGRVFDTPDEVKESNNIKFRHIRVAVEKNIEDSKAEIFDVTLFNKLTDIDLKIDDIVEINARLNANNYEKDGVIRYNCQLIASNLLQVK